MADRNFKKVGNISPKIFKVLQAKIMTGIQPDAVSMGCFGCTHERGNSIGGIGGIFACIGFGVKLHAIRSCRHRIGHAFFCRFDKQRCANPPTLNPCNNACQKFLIRRCIPSCVRCEDTGWVGYKRSLGRTNFLNQFKKIIGRVAFNVKFRGYHAFQGPDIAASDMSFIRPGMHGNAFGAKPLAVSGNPDQVWNLPPAGVAEGGDFVDVHAQANHFGVILDGK